MPAYNASRTLEQTFQEIPAGIVQECIVVDDFSADSTAKVARKLGLRVVLHGENQGYGGNQKTGYIEALKTGGDLVVMLHPVWCGARFEEICGPHRYFVEASTIGFGCSLRYGFGVLVLLAIFFLNRKGLMASRMFPPMHHAYTEAVTATPSHSLGF